MKIRIAVALSIVAATAALGAAVSGGTPAASAHRTASADPAGRARAPRIGLKQIGNFDHPTYVTSAPGFPRLLFVTEQPGRIMVVVRGRKRRIPFLNLTGKVNYNGAERGLLSVAFPPDYRRTGRFYVYYTAGNGAITIDELRRKSPARAAPGSRRNVIRIPHAENSNHNGGQMQFLGNLLYFATGDGGSADDPPGNAQNENVLLGKLLRIDPRRQRSGKPYGIPRSNPFVRRKGRNEIFSYGLRNPYRFSFDRVTGKRPRIVIGDVGQNAIEEIDYETLRGARGANFGWDAYEGYSRHEAPFIKGTQFPAFTYNHSRGSGSCSVIGGYVVRDRQLRGLYGRYVYADLCEGELRFLRPSVRRARADRKVGVSVDTPISFGEDARGRLYVTSLNGPVYRLVSR